MPSLPNYPLCEKVVEANLEEAARQEALRDSKVRGRVSVRFRALLHGLFRS